MRKVSKAMVLWLSLTAGAAVAADESKAPAAAAPSAGSFVAKETVCKNGKNIRKVKLSFGDAAKGSDCKAAYVKETEEPGAEKVLWNSPSHGKACQEHADSFVEKLKSQGWTCE